jgi:hypothetical protein
VKVLTQTDCCTVIDDLLPREQHDAVWNYFQIQPMQRVDNLGLQGHSLLENGAVYCGPTAGWGKKWDAQFPTSTSLDEVMRAVVDAAEHFGASAGKRGSDWSVFSATPTLYGSGQGQHWRRDSEDNAGSYVYYAHRAWNIEWGGELFLSHERGAPREYGVHLHRLEPLGDVLAPPASGSHLDNRDASELLMASGLGSFVMPKPNRLVVIRGGTPYSIAKVRPAAGRHVQACVRGFFEKVAT